MTCIGGFLFVVLNIIISIFEIVFDSAIITFGNTTSLFRLDVWLIISIRLFELSKILNI